MKKRAGLLHRLISAHLELRGRFEEVVSPALQAEFAEYGGLTLQQVVVVRWLLEGRQMTMHDVAEAHGIGASGATQLVDRLERRGLVTRVRDDHDRRVLQVVPTERARDLARRFSLGMNRAAIEFLAVLDDRELETYVDLTERIAESWRRDPRRPERKQSA